ncbi:hypothetical protein [Streptomyces phytophilus]|uniref:hypothetical protein n=1 Tax=Streptomyces phytophilus TaxID=722715 RepID=UPI001C68A279|nr:hypothetical protein [Streptomyces phytophilus]
MPSGVRPEHPNRPPAVHVTSFTYRHGPIPVADITLDLRQFGEAAQLKPDDLTDRTRCDTCTPLAPEADGLPELIEGVVRPRVIPPPQRRSDDSSPHAAGVARAAGC